MRAIDGDHAVTTNRNAGQSAMISQPFIHLENVYKTYDGRSNVLHGLDLDIRQGEFLTLLGPSGSGKTTVLMILAGFEMPSGGHIWMRGEAIERLPPQKRNIGVVFQNYALFPHMTVAENVAYPLAVRGIARDEVRQRVAQALQMVRLDGLGERRPRQLSGGQQQRVALARSLIFRPALVLMDEPLGALDKNLREHMQYEIKRLHNELGLSIVFVTHDQSEAMTMSDRIAVFSEGRVQQIGSPDTIYECPQNAFVAAFVGESNQLRATIDQVEGSECLVRLAGGSKVQASNIADLHPGSLTILSIRPECIQIYPQHSTASGLAARIDDITYRGDHTRVRLVTAGVDEFHVKIPGRRLEGLSVGNEVVLGWDPSDCLALRSTENNRQP